MRRPARKTLHQGRLGPVRFGLLFLRHQRQTELDHRPTRTAFLWAGISGATNFTSKTVRARFDAGIKWGNATGYAACLEPPVQFQTVQQPPRVIFTDYNFSFDGSQSDFTFSLGSRRTRLRRETRLQLLPTPKHVVRIGGDTRTTGTHLTA